MSDQLTLLQRLVDYTQVKQASETIEVGVTPLRILSIDALIQTKKAMNRPRDHVAIRQLEAIKALRQGDPPKE